MELNQDCSASPSISTLNQGINYSPEDEYIYKAYMDNQSLTRSLETSHSVQDLQDAKNIQYPKLTMGMFFEFMKTAYQVNDSFEGLANMLTANSEIDWSKLAKMDLSLQSCIDSAVVQNDGQICKAREDKCIEAVEKNGLDASRSCDDKKAKHEPHTKLIENSSSNVYSMQQTDTEDLKSHEVTEPTKKITCSPNVKCKKSNTVSVKLLTVKDLSSKTDNALNTHSQDTVDIVQVTKVDDKESKQIIENETEPEKIVCTSKEHNLQETENILTKIMKKNLSDILHEGLLDSVLPYMIPRPVMSQPVIKKPLSNVDVKKSSSVPNNAESKLPAAASITKERDKDKNKSQKKAVDAEVEIHVCDEGKNIKKDFRCPQKLLVQKMRYFADVTAEQKLEEIDISVHCDIVIFDWLMRWVKKDIIKKSEWPILEAGNVIPIMVSASFLQMEPLLENCLQYCHDHMSDILKTSTILTCLNDNLLTRLAKLFSNEDVEALKDKKDNIQSRLFCKLIMALAEPMPEKKKGHYSSLAMLYKCGNCGKLVIQSVSDFVPCVPSAMTIDSKGDIFNKHVRDLTWTLNDYVTSLRLELRSWRRVYWKLWGDCHFLFCQQCDTYFAVHQMNWCCYHPEPPQFFVNEQQRPTPFPLGRYPCCSQRAYRFEVLPNREGCRYKEHIPEIKTEKDVDILNIFMAHREIISVDPPQLFFPEKITRLVARDPSLRPGKLLCKESMWWNGIELAPPRSKLGLLGKIWGGSGLRRPAQVQDSQKSSQKIRQQRSLTTDTSSHTSSPSNSDEDDVGTAYEESSADEDSYYSEESNAWATLSLINKPKRRSTNHSFRRDSGRCWSNNLITRYNQDNQRDFEEKAALQMVALLTKRTCTDAILTSKVYNKHWKTNQPRGGIYVRLEAEFREQHAQSGKNKNSVTGKSTTRSKPK